MSYRILVTQPDLRGAKSFVWHTHSSAAAMCTIPEKFCLPSNCSFLFFVVPKCGASSKLISVSGHNMEQAREGDTTQAVAPESNETWVVEAQQKIPGPREKVWAFFTDHAGWPQWTGVAKVTLDPPGEPNPNGVGTRPLSCVSFSNLQQVAYVLSLMGLSWFGNRYIHYHE